MGEETVLSWVAEAKFDRLTKAVLAGALCALSAACANRSASADVGGRRVPARAIAQASTKRQPVRSHAEGSGSRTLPSARSGCDVAQKIAEARTVVAGMSVAVGTKEYTYWENRNGSPVLLKEAEKKIAAVLLDPQSCSLKSTTFTKRGEELRVSNGYVIEPIRRANGIRWNNWATEYQVLSPPGEIVVAVKYPFRRETMVARTVRTARGRRKVVYDTRREAADVLHTPYDDALRTPEMVGRGVAYLRNVVNQARDRLRRAQVRSRAFPGLLVADVKQLPPEFTMRRAPNEHMEETEFNLDPARTSDRIHVIIGANGPTTSNYTCSPARACGLWQFTEPTYREMRRQYPSANLIPDFKTGSRDHVNVAAAAILLDDFNLARLIDTFGPRIAEDPRLEEYLTAAYNTGVNRVIAVLRLARTRGSFDWTQASGTRCGPANRYGQCLMEETRVYLAKLRYLRDRWPTRLATSPAPEPMRKSASPSRERSI
jgi:hypothetical protein